MKVAYVGAPYRADTEWGVEQNIRAAEAIARALWQWGYAVVCPHLNSAHLGGLCPDETWLKGYLEILSRCDLFVAGNRWKTSEGTIDEIDRAEVLGIPVFYWACGGDQDWLRGNSREMVG